MQAVQTIAEQAAIQPPVYVPAEKKTEKKLILPKPYRYQTYAVSYLQNRGIDMELMPVLSWGNRLVEKYGTQKRNLTAKMISIVLEYVKGMKVFKSHNMTSSHFSRMTDTLDAIRKTNVKAEVKMAAPTSMYSIVANFLLPLVLLVGSYLFLGGTIAPDQLVAFMLMSLALSALLIAFEHSYNLLKDLNLAAHNLEQAYDEYSGLRAPPIRNGIPTKRRMIPTSFLHAIRRNVLSVRK